MFLVLLEEGLPVESGNPFLLSLIRESRMSTFKLKILGYLSAL